ncbi:hypothetical protein GCM10025865_06010 [Paraoerskovia sediminicola]|uniref:Uncharacterized protein n=1 Tax=Paraoerskovia sediminicola TaxID=1138587 RepID=A0ABM8FZU7_9CELL|nr:hypothetical protein GCM10025865_06010 [Paraoerskovia sediminicola]
MSATRMLVSWRQTQRRDPRQPSDGRVGDFCAVPFVAAEAVEAVVFESVVLAPVAPVVNASSMPSGR